jgi:hypothetical protein
MIIEGQKRVWQDVPLSYKGKEFIVDSLVESEHGEQITLWHLEGEEPGSRTALTDFMVERSREVMDPMVFEVMVENLTNDVETLAKRMTVNMDDAGYDPRIRYEDLYPQEFITDLAEFLDKWYGTIVDGDV